jgi:heptosyltransferase-1
MTPTTVSLGLPARHEEFAWRPDCRHFVGGLPCRHWRACPGCEHYDPIQQRVLIVMLGLLGDMLIASPLPARIKRDNPATHITWLVDDACAPILRMNPDVDRILPFDWHTATHLLSETFTAVYSFERTPSAASLVDRLTADHKAGLAYGGPHNGLYAMGAAAAHFFRMNTWNDFRTRLNTTTWTELYFAVAGYQYQQEPYVLQVPAPATARVAALLPATDRPRVCLNVGGSLPTKIWPAAHWFALGAALLEQGCEVVVTGGPTDEAMCQAVHRGLAAHGPGEGRVRYAPLSIEEFAAVPPRCDVVVTGDSLGFHLALAHETPCVLLLGPSNGAEVIPKHVQTVAALRGNLPCSPCAHQVSCGGAGGCMDTITPTTVLAETRRLLAGRRDRAQVAG